jgi:hypothetical protein
VQDLFSSCFSQTKLQATAGIIKWPLRKKYSFSSSMDQLNIKKKKVVKSQSGV